MVRGTVYHVALDFMLGCNREVSVVIMDMEHQVWPSNPDGAFAGEGVNIVFEEEYEIESPAGTLRLEGWAPDAVWPHTVAVRFGVKEGRVRRLESLLGGVFKRV